MIKRSRSVSGNLDAADRPLVGIALMVTGVGVFAAMDAIIKWMTTDYSVAQIVALRSWFGLPLLYLLVHFEGGIQALRTSQPMVHVGRYLLVVILSFSFFWALSKMKLVDAVAITFAAPIFISALSVPLLRETVGVRRWCAIGAGFLGVLVMLRPGSGVFQWAALVALGSVLAYALLMITTRALKSSETTAALMFYPQLGLSISGLFLAPLYWVTPDLKDLMLFALAGAFGSVGIMCLTRAMKLAPAATVAPFEYTALIWAAILGYMIWRELPDTATIAGAGIVIMSGLYILYRETLKSDRSPSQVKGVLPDDTGQ